MTELQPTEIEFRKKGRERGSSSTKKIAAAVGAALFLLLAAGLTLLLAHRASSDPAILEPSTLPADE